MATHFTFNYKKLKFLQENIINKNIQYFTADRLEPIFNLSLQGELMGEVLPEINCSLVPMGLISESKDTLCESIKDHVGLVKYKNNYFTYYVEKKRFIHIKNNQHLINYLIGLTYSTKDYYISYNYPPENLKLYKINAYEIYYK